MERESARSPLGPGRLGGLRQVSADEARWYARPP